eukprot:7604297-Prorocentrum_lima.AAC.1
MGGVAALIGTAGRDLQVKAMTENCRSSLGVTTCVLLSAGASVEGASSVWPFGCLLYTSPSPRDSTSS